ncbi:MAG: major facilitator superfamily 1 [Deltaproteobacteria bacterium]|nr:major facilitator superfamily 1 [Deltaproteobacteria bacterium]
MPGNSSGKTEAVHWAWVILAVCFVNLFINYAIRLGYGTILPEMIRTMGITRKDGGQIFNAYFYAYIVFSPFVGYLTDRLGARVVIPAFGLVLGLGTLFMGSAQSFWGAAIPFLFVGIGAAAMWTPIITLVQRWFALHRRGMALGILSAGFGLGFAATGKLYPVIVSHWSWRYCWYIFGIAALCMIGINILLLRSRPEDKGRLPWGSRVDEPPAAAPSVKQQSCYGEILSAKRFWMIAASYFSIGATLYMITTFMVDYARYELGFAYERASFLATMHGIGQVVGVLTIPLLSDYLGRKKTISISNLCIAATIVWIVLARGNIGMLYMGIFLFGIFYGSTFPLYGACGGDYFRKEIIGTVIGAFTPFYAFGAITAHWFGGYVRDVTGSFFIPFIVAIFLGVIASGLMMLVKKEPDGQIT